MDPLANTFTYMPQMPANQATEINLGWLDKLPIEHTIRPGMYIDSISCSELKGTTLSCPTSSFAGKWENRLTFLKKILLDAIKSYPKDEPLAFISIGSFNLLMEYLIAKGLIEQGFQKLYIFPVDTSYKFDEQHNINCFKEQFTEFRSLIDNIHQEKWHKPMPKEQIHFFSRAQNVSSYFENHTHNAHVLLMQSLPPYGEFIKGFKMYNLPPRKEKDFVIGSSFVPASEANAISFMPQTWMQRFSEEGIIFSQGGALPITYFKKPNSSTTFSLDWGCKIYADGRFYISFLGAEGYFEQKSISPYQLLKLRDGQTIVSSQLFPTIQNKMAELLDREIVQLKNGNPQSTLTQFQKTNLLERVKDIFDQHFGKSASFYTAEYEVDCTDMVNALKKYAGQHRKSYALYSDNTNSYAINETEF